jgi:hypothetical protein
MRNTHKLRIRRASLTCHVHTALAAACLQVGQHVYLVSNAEVRLLTKAFLSLSLSLSLTDRQTAAQQLVP